MRVTVFLVLGCVSRELYSVDCGKKSRLSFRVTACLHATAVVEPHNTVLCRQSLLEHILP